MDRTQQLVQHFLSHRNVTVELIGKIEEENYNYKPTPTSMSTQELATHILTSFYQFASLAKKGEAKPLETNETNLAKLADIYTEATQKLLEDMHDEDFDRVVEAMGAQMPAGQLLQIAMDHEINHKGNLFVYVRELGHTDLPMFVKRG
ncbi:DinB family protein [Tuberibacillus sp. Marseille-P3662]|uniref:DinB family protein n=1 Tax=Tuberibacillus sp. Marseille-P3662 TaxID=1965358 RepID=UPI000A1CD295|nr:DinB family protein [Tuberibacillus sp. Marseille-P3662]